MNPFRRIFGLGPSRMAARPDEVYYDNGKGERILMADATSADAIAARHNFAAIYGADNMPANFAKQGVIQVQKDGQWTNVNGTSLVPGSMQTQTAALQSYRETGIIGPQPVNEQGNMQPSSGPVGSAGAGTADSLNAPAAAADGSIPKEGLALLNAISGPESGGRYDIRYGGLGSSGKTFDTNGMHPRIAEDAAGGTKSTAAGRYQFTAGTWDEFAGADTPMTPANQDRAAWKLAQDRYKRTTGRDLLGDLRSGGLNQNVMNGLSGTWAAWNNPKGQQQSLDIYNNSIGGLRNRPDNDGPNLIQSQTQEPATFGSVIQRGATDPRRADVRLPGNLPSATRNDTGMANHTPSLAQSIPQTPSLIDRVPAKARTAPQMIQPQGSNF